MGYSLYVGLAETIEYGGWALIEYESEHIY